MTPSTTLPHRSHPRLLLELPNPLRRLRLPHAPGLHLLARLPRHGGNISRLLPRRLILARGPGVGVLDRLAGRGARVLALRVFELVDLLGRLGFVQARGVELGVFVRGEGGEEGFLLLGGGVVAGGPLGRLVELGGHDGGGARSEGFSSGR